MKNCMFVKGYNLELYFIIWNKTQMTHVGKYDSAFAHVINAKEIKDDINL